MQTSSSAKKRLGKDPWSIFRNITANIIHSVKAGAAHIAFTAPSRTAVRDFYTAALTAGGRPNGAPASRCDEDSHFNAAVLDLDGNSIEVVFRNGPDLRDDGTVIGHSRVIKWQRSVHESYESFRSESRSIVSSHTSASRAAPIEKAESIISKAPSSVSKAGSIARSVSEPVAVPQTTTTSDAGSGAAKQIIGTLLGAAAGAAVAYAMVRSEQDSAKKESDFSAFMDAKNFVKGAAGYLAQASSQPKQPQQAPQPAIEAATPTPESVHRNNDAQSYRFFTPPQPRSVYAAPKQIDNQSYHSSTPPQPRSVYAPTKQIDAQSYHSSVPPQPWNNSDTPRQLEAQSTYYSASVVSNAKTKAPAPLALEYAPAASVAPTQARSRHTNARSVTSPELLTIEKARSTASTAKPLSIVSKARSAAPSAAPSSLISSFVPDHVPRHASEGSVHSHHSSRSKAKSSHTETSRHTSKSRHSRSHHEAVESSPSPPPPSSKTPSKAPSKAASVISSIFGGSSASKNNDDDFIDDLDIEELTEDDLDTVVPSDSISQIGSSHTRRKHKSSSKKYSSDAASSISKHSTSSKHTSSRSHRSHKKDSDDGDADDDDRSTHSTESRRRRKHKPSVVSEPSDASTVRPVKSKDRKDSVTQGQYDNLFDETVKYGTGSVAVRGITPSMVSKAEKNRTRTVVRHDMAQKARQFEGQIS